MRPQFTETWPPTLASPQLHSTTTKRNLWPSLALHFGHRCRGCANTFGAGLRDQAVLWVESQKQNVLVLLPSWCLRTWLSWPRNCLPADVILPGKGKQLWVQQFRSRSERRWGSEGHTSRLAAIWTAWTHARSLPTEASENKGVLAMFVGRSQLQNPRANLTGPRGTSTQRGWLGIQLLLHSLTRVSGPRGPAGHLTLKLTVEIISMLHLHPAFKIPA